MIAKRVRTMKLAVCCYITCKDTRANFCFGCYHLDFMKKPWAVKIMHMVFWKMKWTSFYWYCYLAETKNLFKICVFFFLFFSHQKRISSIRTPKIHTACHTLKTYGHFWLYCVSATWKKNIGKKQKDLRLCWPLIVLSINTLISLNCNFYL